MAWLGVCSTIFCYQHSLPSIVKGFFLITSWNLILSIVLFTRSRVQSYAPPPPPKKKGEGSEGTVLLRRPIASVSPWVREGGGGGGSTAARWPSVCLCMPNAWDIVTRSVKII